MFMESLAAVGDVAYVLLALLARPGNWVEGGVEEQAERAGGEMGQNRDGERTWGQAGELLRAGGGQVAGTAASSPLCVPGRAWGTGHTGWAATWPVASTASCPHPCSWDTCRPCGAAFPQAGPLPIGLFHLGSWIWVGSAH